MNTVQDVFNLILAIRQAEMQVDAIVLAMLRISDKLGMSLDEASHDEWTRWFTVLTEAADSGDIEVLHRLLNHSKVDTVDLVGFIRFSGNHGKLSYLEDKLSELLENIDEEYEEPEEKDLFLNGHAVTPLKSGDLCLEALRN